MRPGVLFWRDVSDGFDSGGELRLHDECVFVWVLEWLATLRGGDVLRLLSDVIDVGLDVSVWLLVETALELCCDQF